MALPVLDGNQSATTLSSVVTGGEHIVAHSVVSLGSTAISNITSAVSGSVVSVSNFPASQSTTFGAVTGSVSVLNFPATQTIAGTVTANDSGALSIVNSSTVTKADVKFTAIAGAHNPSDFAGTYTLNPINVDADGIVYVDGQYVSYRGTCVTYNPSTAETAWKTKLVESTVTVGNSVTIGSLPAISGTVTVSNATTASAVFVKICGEQTGAGSNEPREIQTDQDGFLYARLFDPSLPTAKAVIYDPTVGNAYVNVRQQTGSSITVGNSVTIGAMPNGALTTAFGTPTTASVAFATAAVTKSDRKYLLIQNVTTGSNVITVGIGFTPTTTQGIQLTAGAGITFESSYIPTGAVYVLSSVTASNFTILEA